MKIMNVYTCMAAAVVLGVAAGAASSSFAAGACQDGEIVIKFSHVTNTDKHPKGVAASLLEKRVNEEMNGKVCMEVFPSSQTYNDDQVLEAMRSYSTTSTRSTVSRTPRTARN